MLNCSLANELLPIEQNVDTVFILCSLGLNQLDVLQTISSFAFAFGLFLVKQRGLILFDLEHHDQSSELHKVLWT